MLHGNILNYLNNLIVNKENGYASEYHISSTITNILSELNDYQSSFEDLSEKIAFEFVEDYTNKETGWNTYYGPMMVFPNEQNQMVEYPSIKKVTLETLNYWVQRSKETSNPILSGRYSDLVIEFNKIVTGKNPANLIDLVLIVINSNIKICDNLLLDPIYCKAKIKRSLDLAIKFKSNPKIDLPNIIQKVISLEEKIGADDKPGLWGFAFNWLILEKNRNLVIVENKKNELIQKMEDRLKRVKESPHLAEHAVGLLAEFYSSSKDETNLIRVLKIFEDSYKLDTRLNSEPILQTHAYQEIREIYKLYQDKGFGNLKKELDRITKEINNLDLDWNNSLKKFETKKDIPTKDIQDFLDPIFNDVENILPEEKLKIVLMRVVINFLPKKEDLEKQFNEIVTTHPLKFLFSNQIISDEGFITGTIVGIDNKNSKKHHFIRNSSQNLSFDSYLLELVFSRLKSEYGAKEVFEILENSVVFEEENKDYLNRAIGAFWTDDFIVSSHLFIPIIETGIRKLVKINDGDYLSYISDNGGYQVKTLTTLFSQYDKVIDLVFSRLDKEVSFYLKLVLTENFGFNLRNDFAHGINKRQFFSRQVSNRLFHIVLLLSLVELKSNTYLTQVP